MRVTRPQAAVFTAVLWATLAVIAFLVWLIGRWYLLLILLWAIALATGR